MTALWGRLLCWLGRHAWGKAEPRPFYQEEIDVRTCARCKHEDVLFVGWSADFLRRR